MKKSHGLITITGLLLILPLFRVQGTTADSGLHNFPTKPVKLIVRNSKDSKPTLSQRSATSLNYIKDYISQQQSPRLMAVPDGELVPYKAFDGTIYSLQQYTGKYTAILMKPEDVEFYTLVQLRELLDQCDLLYTYYKEIVPTEPEGEGVTTIAIVKTIGNALGRGRLGAKGMEIDPSTLQPENFSTYSVIVHEMAHNFDQYSRAIMVGSDPVHAWTIFCEAFVTAFYSGEAINPNAAFEKFINLTLNEYLKNPAASWETCIKDSACQSNLQSNSLQASTLLRVVQLFGPAIVTRWLEQVRDASRSLDFTRMSPIDKNDVLVESLSKAVNANLLCFFDYLRWPVSDLLRTKLQRKYADSAVCMDRDNDGYSLMTGDYDDVNSMVHPGAVEVVNGIDDDCNLIVDDILLSEIGDFPNTVSSALQLPIPCRVRGTISSATDFDHFQVNFPTEATVVFSGKATDDFIGWIYYPSDLQDPFSYFQGESGRQPFTVPAGVWNFAIAVASPPNFSHYPTHLGSYEMRIQTTVEDSDFPTLPPVRVKHFNDYLLTAPPIPAKLSRHSNVTARFWVSSVGWVGSPSASHTSETIFEWIAPVGTIPGKIWYRVQYYEDFLPLTGVTSPATIDLTYDPVSGPAINSATFDGKKAGIISGARFGSAPQVIINYVDRSSAIKSVSDTSITFKGKAKKLGLKAGDNKVQIVDSSGVASNLFVLRL